MQDLHENHNVNILMVTHDAFSASYCERILFIQDGLLYKELNRQGTRENFYQDILGVLAHMGSALSLSRGETMLFKLSRHSMKKMLKDYMVLLIGLVISISIFYMFQTMAMNSEFTKDNSLISSIRLVFWVGAILLSFITVFYIIYANSFLLTLRRKELGMYMMLGAKKKKVAQLLFIETFGMGIVSIIIGILVGMLLASVAGNF